MSFEAAGGRRQAAARGLSPQLGTVPVVESQVRQSTARHLTAACRLLPAAWIAPAALLLLLLLPSCRIGSGFDTAEKRSNLLWDDTPVVEVADTPKQPEELPPEALKAPPIVYLLVAG